MKKKMGSMSMFAMLCILPEKFYISFQQFTPFRYVPKWLNAKDKHYIDLMIFV